MKVIALKNIILEKNTITYKFDIPEELRTWDSLADYDKLVNIKVTDKPEVLFARLETEPEIEVIKEMMK